MAEKRMFTKQIIDSDAFMNMPVSSRELYFQLNMRGDDDGFVNAPKNIVRMCGASEDDLKLLMMKKFVIGFESGIIVIKHWRMHNTLQTDRYRETVYKEEKAMLEINENKSYSLKKSDMETNCLQDGNRVYPQSSIDKNRQDKIRQEDDEHTHADESVSDSKKETKKAYGEFKSVRLTDDEYEKIKSQDLLPYIDRLDAYIASQGKRYKSHYATILNWHRSDLAKAFPFKPSRSEPIPDYDSDRKPMTQDEIIALKERLNRAKIKTQG